MQGRSGGRGGGGHRGRPGPSAHRALGGRRDRVRGRTMATSGYRRNRPAKSGAGFDFARNDEVFAIGDTATADAWRGKPVPGLAPAAKVGTMLQKSLPRDWPTVRRRHFVTAISAVWPPLDDRPLWRNLARCNFAAHLPGGSGVQRISPFLSVRAIASR